MSKQRKPTRSRKGKGRNWSGLVRNAHALKMSDDWFAAQLVAQLSENGGPIRGFMFQRELGEEDRKEHIQLAIFLKNTATAVAMSKKKLLGNINISYRKWDHKVAELVKYVQKEGADGRMEGHEVLQGM